MLACSVLLFRLFYLTTIKGEYYYDISHDRKTINIELRGTRGLIFDRNGLPMASNRQIFSVHIDRRAMPVGHSNINRKLLNFIEILDSNSEIESLYYNLPIEFNKYGEIRYVWENEDYDSQKAQSQRWIKKASIDSLLPVDDMLLHLRDRYDIDESIPDYKAMKIISIRLDLFMNRFTANPIKIARDVSHSTVAKLEVNSEELPGIRTFVETERFYPLNETAAHIIGYVGKIDEQALETYTLKGYNQADDRIGIKGIEYFAEDWLTSAITQRHGRMLAEVDSRGRIIQVFDKVAALDGNNIILTIDLILQKTVEDILRQEISKMSMPEPQYPYSNENRAAPLATKGAAVVIDVRTGEILTMASYPSFNLNWFINGMSPEEEYIINERRALNSIAFRERYAPGSIFKMLVGIAGLKEGKLSPDEEIVCRDEFIRHGWTEDEAPGCWAEWGHGPLTVTEAIKVSCNYFFYEVADRLGIEALNYWADALGINGITGLEGVEEVESFVGQPETKAEIHKSTIARHIRMLMNENIPEFSSQSNDIRDMHITRLSDLPYDTTLTEIRRIISDEMGYLSTRDERSALFWLAERIRFDVLRQYKRWRPMDTVLTGTGQAEVRMSVLSAARYAATIANAGRVFRPQLVRAIVHSDGEIEYIQPELLKDFEIEEDYIRYIKQGMYEAVFNASTANGGAGTAVRIFEGINETITLAGKTGTSQTVAGVEERNTAWFIAFTPVENPEIAIAVMIPNGRASSNAAHIARLIIEEYYRINIQRESFNQKDRPNALNLGY